MIRKIVVLGWIVCITMVFSFQALSFISPVQAVPSKWPMRVLLASQKKSIALMNENLSFLTQSGSYHLPQQELRFTPLKEKKSYPNGYYTIQLRSEMTLSDAQQVAVSTRKQYFKDSDCSLFIQETAQNQFSVSLGLFSDRKEVDFITSFLIPYFPGMKNTKHDTTENAVALLIEQNVLLISEFTDSTKATECFSFTNDQSSCRYEKISYPDQLVLYLCDDSLSLVNHTDIETYLRGVVGSEMPDEWPLEALKAQTLASRTYAYSRSLAARQRNGYYDVTNDTNSQVYLGIRSLPNSFQAIRATEGLIITCQSKPIESVFHSSSGGYTENNEFIWSGSPSPYLRGVPSPGEEISPHFSWYRSYSRQMVVEKLNGYLLQKKIPTLNDHPFTLSISEKGISPRVRKVSVQQDDHEMILSGSDFVNIFGLKSTWFDFYWYTPEQTGQFPPMILYFGNHSFSPDSKQTTLYIVGRGWGHGVGMSQYGALAMAKKGFGYEAILSHFYSSTHIEKIPSPASLQSWHTFQNQLFFDPCCVQVQNGTFLDVTIKIKTQTNLFGVSFEMKYPKELIILHKEEIREGTFLKSDQKSTLFMVTESEKGYTIGLSREGKVGGVSGEGDLLFFRFQASQPGLGTIQLFNLQALDSRLEPIAIQAQTMEITVTQQDIEPPVTTITKTPNEIINQRKVNFEWTGHDNQTPVSELLYAYRLDQEPWSAFSFITNVSLSLVSDGPHVFSVQAKDKEGNIEASPPTFSFILDTTPPVLTVAPVPERTSLSEIIILGVTESDVTIMMNGQSMEVSPEGSFSIVVPLEMGENKFQLIAMDRATNVTIVDIRILRQDFQPIIITMNIGSKKAIVDDKILTLDSAPFIQQNRTFVPLRFIAEAFGANVQWFPESKKIEIHLVHPLVKKQIELWVDQTTAYVNQTPFLIDAAPFIVPPGRTVVPIRFIAESMESKVEWFSMTQSIRITFPTNEINKKNGEFNFGR